MKDKRKVHKRKPKFAFIAICGRWVGWGWVLPRFTRRWSDVTCERCRKHKPKIRLGKVASDEIGDIVSKRRQRSGLMHRETLRDGTRFFVPK